MDSTEKQADKALVKAVNKQHSLHTWSIRAKCFQGSQIWILATFLPLLFVCSWQSSKKLLDMGLWDMTTSAKGRALLCSQPLVPTACQRLLKLMNAGRERCYSPLPPLTLKSMQWRLTTNFSNPVPVLEHTHPLCSGVRSHPMCSNPSAASPTLTPIKVICWGAGTNCLCGYYTLSALLKPLSSQVWWCASCIYTNCIHFSCSPLHALDKNHILVQVSESNAELWCHGFNKKKETIFLVNVNSRDWALIGSIQQQTHLVCGCKGCYSSWVWEWAKMSGQTLAVTSLFSGVKETSNQTQTALFYLSFNKLKLRAEFFPAPSLACMAAKHPRSVHVQADEENGRISLGCKGKLNHYQLYKKLLRVV